MGSEGCFGDRTVGYPVGKSDDITAASYQIQPSAAEISFFQISVQ